MSTNNFKESNPIIESKTLIEVTSLFHSSAGHEVIEDFNISVRPGDSIALYGPNGAGKTTLLRLMSGKIRPKKGEILYKNMRVDERNVKVRSELASLVATPSLYPDLTVREQLSLIGISWGMESSEVSAGVSDILSRFESIHLEKSFIHELSSGQLQLFTLLTVLLRPFELLILDEPEQRLDDFRKRILVKWLQDRVDQGAAVIFASHDEYIISQLSNKTRMLGLE